MHRSAVRGVLGFHAAAVAAVLLSPPAAFAGPSSTLVGVILPRDIRPGDLVSGALVMNPAAFEGVPGLSVVTFEVPAAGKVESPVPGEMTVELGDGRVQGGGSPIKVRLERETKAISVTLRVAGGPPLRKDVPIVAASVEAQPRSSSRFETSPLCVDGSVSVVRGFFGGHAAPPRVTVGGHPVQRVAETPRAPH